MKSKHVCFGCLSIGHAAKDCQERKTCTVANCGKKHKTILHTNTANRTRPAETPAEGTSPREDSTSPREESTSPREEPTRVRNAMVNLARAKMGMAVVPVKVWPKAASSPVITYAFLDSGSSSSFCTETLMRQLGVNGQRTQICLTTLEKKDSLTDSFIVKDLVISDLDENISIDLPAL